MEGSVRPIVIATASSRLLSPVNGVEVFFLPAGLISMRDPLRHAQALSVCHSHDSSCADRNCDILD